MLVLLGFPLYKPDKLMRTFNTTRFNKLDLGEPSYTNQTSAPASQQRRQALGSEKLATERPARGAVRFFGSRRGAQSFLKSVDTDDDPDMHEDGAFFTTPTKKTKLLTPRTTLPQDQWCTYPGCMHHEDVNVPPNVVKIDTQKTCC